MFEEQKMIYLKNGPIYVSHWCLKIEKLIYPKKCIDLSQPLVFENRYFDISLEMDQLKSASGVWN